MVGLHEKGFVKFLVFLRRHSLNDCMVYMKRNSVNDCMIYIKRDGFDK